MSRERTGRRLRRGDGPDPRILRVLRALFAGASLALALVVVPSCLSASASASTPGQSGAVASASSWSPRAFTALSGSASRLSVQLCETLAGAYPFPSPAPSGYSVPSWVPPQGEPLCVVLDESALRDPPPDSPPEPEPSPSPEPTYDPSTGAILEEVQGFRELALYSGGLLIFLSGAIFFRSRMSR